MFAFGREFLLQEKVAQTTLQGDRRTIYLVESHNPHWAENFDTASRWGNLTQREVCYHSCGVLGWLAPTQSWALEIKGLMTLIWEGETQTISYVKGQDFSLELLWFWVLHTFFPLVLEWQKVAHILHVGGVEVAGKVLLFSAFSGGGKSTLTSYFLDKGHTIYGDDTVALRMLEGEVEVEGSYPFYRPFRVPEVLGNPIEHFAKKRRRLHAIYQLKPIEKENEVSIRILEGVEKFEALYQSKFITFPFMQKERFLFATALAKRVLVYQLSIPWEKKRLDEVYQAILTHNGV
jgi:hypothetical protein